MYKHSDWIKLEKYHSVEQKRTIHAKSIKKSIVNFCDLVLEYK